MLRIFTKRVFVASKESSLQRFLRSSANAEFTRHLNESDNQDEPNMDSSYPKDASQAARDYRKAHKINIADMHGKSIDGYEPVLSFESTPFDARLIRVFESQGYDAPTATQAQSWPIALDKRDLISVAKTGSGKTCGFLLPAIHNILQHSRKNTTAKSPSTERQGRRLFSSEQPKVLVLAPTRELTVQIAAESEKYTKATSLKTVCLFGGASREPQISLLRSGCDIVIGTPGRCNDLREAGFLNLSGVHYFVLDEADRMLDMGFEPQIRQLIAELPPDRQNLFFTATWPKEVRYLAHEFLSDPIKIEIGDQDQLNANPAITQKFEFLRPAEKEDRLLEILNEINPDPQKNKANLPKIIIFRGRKGETETLADTLYDAGFDCDTLHGDRPQASRERIMDAFRKNKIKLLIATDVAARGLDVKDIEYVINFDFPNNITDYVHRIGRTARANNTGTSISFLTTADERYYGELVGLLKRCNQEIPPPLASYSSSRVYSGSGGDEGRYSRKSVGRSNFGRSSSNGYGGRSNSGRGGRSDYMVHRGRDDYSNNDYRSRGRGDERGRTRNLFESDYDDPRRGGKARRTAEDFEDFDH